MTLWQLWLHRGSCSWVSCAILQLNNTILLAFLILGNACGVVHSAPVMDLSRDRQVRQWQSLPTGDKLRILGAEISAGGQQSEVLEAAKTTFLRIHYNGTHRYATVTVITLIVPTKRLGNGPDLDEDC